MKYKDLLTSHFFDNYQKVIFISKKTDIRQQNGM